MKEKIKNFIFKHQYGIITTLVGLIVAIVDLTTKVVTDGRSRTIIKGFISIFSSHNTGAAWSMLSGQTWFLVLFSAIFIGVILFANYMFKGKNNLYSFAMGMLLAGAICNLYDRIVFGYVRDFISLDFMDFPIFNVADCGITIGVILLLLFFLIDWIKEAKAKKAVSTPVSVKNAEDDIINTQTHAKTEIETHTEKEANKKVTKTTSRAKFNVKKGKNE